MESFGTAVELDTKLMEESAGAGSLSTAFSGVNVSALAREDVAEKDSPASSLLSACKEACGSFDVVSF